MVDRNEFDPNGIPLGTPVVSLVGHQCILSEPRLGGPVRRCTNIGACVVVVKCKACGQGGMIVACDRHTRLMMALSAAGEGRCAKCEEPKMSVSEPIKFSSLARAEDTVSAAPKTSDEEFWEMDW